MGRSDHHLDDHVQCTRSILFVLACGEGCHGEYHELELGCLRWSAIGQHVVLGIVWSKGVQRTYCRDPYGMTHVITARAWALVYLYFSLQKDPDMLNQQ